MKKLGQGASRKAYLREDGKVIKKPRYDSQFNWLGAPSPEAFRELMEEFSNDPSIMKIQAMKERGMRIPSPCLGTLAEYLLSLKLKKSSVLSEYFALCEEIKIRKRNKKDQIAIVGIYENGYEKIANYDLSDSVTDIILDLPYEVEDLHCDNTLGDKIIVDYACISVAE